MAARTVDLHETLVLNATVEQLWPLLSDTSRVNRLVGLPASQQVEPGENFSRVISSNYFGVPVSWRELPFQWVFEQWHEVERVFAPPIPIERISVATTLGVEHGQTRVDVRVRLVNRNAAGWLASQFVVGRKMMRDLMRVYRQLDRLAVEGVKVLPPPQPPRFNAARLAAGLVRLHELQLDDQLITLLGAHIRQADDADVIKMQPYRLSDSWGTERMAVLRLCLYATRAGLLDLEWDVICPHCRGASQRASTLQDLHHDVYCPSCNIHYDLDFDEAVELRFSVSPSVREALDISYCVGGPANTRHVLGQIQVPAGSTRDVALQIAPGRYRVRCPPASSVVQINALAEAAASELTLLLDEDSFELSASELRAGWCRLRLANRTDQPRQVVVEDRAWSRHAASAAQVTAWAEFRQLFSSEVLAPGVGVSVRNLTFLFSDLKGSTSIYDTIGDAPAYARVRDHFTVMRARIAERNGTLVKTIGDAVMAVFSSSEEALAAALAIQREFTAGEIAQGNPALRVKIGLHRGPCIAVNANELLDYFGTTVNVAARIQGESSGGDIVFSEAVAEDPGVQFLLAREQPIEQFERTLRGVSQRYKLYRLEVAPELVGAV
ncbi:MAG: adenylate/guanylate cyclase domain-containing protein [Roseiflexaceae bacterium]|nr:adenylate/guanylate cyclase domain-containing protein [Roseiflexaceae bacterium]